MTKMRGTPKTMTEAISNGLEDYGFLNNDKLALFVFAHVKDFIAQKAIDRDDKIDEAFKLMFEKIFKGDL